METAVVALRVALSLAVVFGLLWYLHRRLTRGAKARGAAVAISVVGKQAVGQKASVVVVDADGRRFVLGVTEHAITVLHDAETPASAFAEALTAVAPDAAPAAGAPAKQAAASGLVAPGPVAGALAGSIRPPATGRQAITALGRGR
jgi:flagellar protein FliO/FliZ